MSGSEVGFQRMILYPAPATGATFARGLFLGSILRVVLKMVLAMRRAVAPRMAPVYRSRHPVGIDTVKLRSPSINEGLAGYLERQSILKSGVDLGTGEILYEITTGELEGSWDSRVSFRVMREEWTQMGGRLELMPCEPYVLLEASWHKFFYGQNVYGAPENFPLFAQVFVDAVGDLLNDGLYEDGEGMLPSADLWEVRRVDWAEMYRLAPAAIAEFFRGISHCNFPRRSAKSAKYGVNAVYYPGTTTTLKLYHKGPEFKEHDRSRLRRSLTAYFMAQAGEHRRQVNGGVNTDDLVRMVELKLQALQRLADNRLRCEVEIHADKLNHDFGDRYPKVSEVTDEYLKRVHDEEMFKLLREGKTEMETVRTHDAVKLRLSSMYGKRSANSLWSFWLQMATRGEEVCKLEYSESQFYSNRKKLVDSACSWHSSNVYIIANDSALDRDFYPMRDHRRRCVVPVSTKSVFHQCPADWGLLRAAA